MFSTPHHINVLRSINILDITLPISCPVEASLVMLDSGPTKLMSLPSVSALLDIEICSCFKAAD